MKRVFGKIIGLMFLVNLLFFIGASFFCIAGQDNAKPNGSTSSINSHHAYLQNLSIIAENIEIDEEETEEDDKLDKLSSLTNFDFFQTSFQLSFENYFISPKSSFNQREIKAPVAFRKLYCVYLI